MPSAVPPQTQPRAEPIRRAVIGSWRVELLPRTAYEAAYTAGHAVVGFAFESQCGMHAFASDRRTAFRTRPNSLALVPAGCDVYSQSSEGGEYLTVAIPAPLDDVDVPAARRFNDIVDPAAIEAAQAIRGLLLARGSPDAPILEHHALTLHRCALRALGGEPAEPRAAQWLTPQRLRRIDGLIEARLDGGGPLAVQDLAEALALSAGFFSRAFKAATGKPPHAYVLDRRIARARALLLAPMSRAGRNLSAVAHATGFSSHAHMTAAFRSRLGVAPSDLATGGGRRRPRG